MQVEDFDFAIYGSGIDAAFLAAELVQRHDARVLLVRDHVNDYTLQHHQDFSVGANCDFDTIRVAHAGLERWHSQFSGRLGRACFDRGPISLKVSSSANADMLHYIEGALIACDRQSERRAQREGSEYLQIRDVIAPKRRETLEFICSSFVGVGLDVYDRSDFHSAKRNKDGRLSLKSDTKHYTASQTIMLDDDLVEAHSNPTFRKLLVQLSGTKIALAPLSKYSKPPTLFVDSNLCLRARGNIILVTAPLGFEDLVEKGKNEILDLEQLSVRAQGAFRAVYSIDGAPILGFEKSSKTWVFSGGTVRTFLMPSVSDIIANKTNEDAERYWLNRSATGQRFADIGAPKNAVLGDKNATV